MAVINFLAALVAVLGLALPGARWRRHRRRGVAACLVAAVSLAATAAHTAPVTGPAGAWLLVELSALAVLVQVAARWAPGGWAVAAVGLGTAAAAAQPIRMFWGASPPPTRAETVFLIGCWAAVVLAAAAVGGLRRWVHRRRARMAAGVRRAERLALAGDLHDLVAHDVTGIVLEAQAGRAEGGAGTDRETLDRIAEAGLQALAAIDRTVEVLHAEDGGLGRGTYRIGDLPDLIGRFGSGRMTVRAELATDLPDRVPREVGDAMYRLVAESLTNVRRHAPDAREVRITGFVDGDSVLRFTISDSGTPGRRTHRRRARRGGYGLVGLAARVEALGGALSAGATPDGWSVTATVPVRSVDAGSPR